MGELYSIFLKERMKITENIEILFDTITKKHYLPSSPALPLGPVQRRSPPAFDPRSSNCSRVESSAESKQYSMRYKVNENALIQFSKLYLYLLTLQQL